MDKTEYQFLIDYVSPFYNDKDILHGIDHIERLLYTANEIIESEGLEIDNFLLVYGAYFHGLVSQNMAEIESFISEHDLPSNISHIAKESLGKSQADTLEGKVLSDAHVLEGGSYMRYLKPLLTGTYMHQSLADTFLFIEKNILEKGNVYFESSKQKLAQYNQEIAVIHQEIKAEMVKRMDPEEFLVHHLSGEP